LDVETLENGMPNVIEMLYTNDDLYVYPTENDLDEFGIYVGDWWWQTVGNTTTIPVLIS